MRPFYLNAESRVRIKSRPFVSPVSRAQSLGRVLAPPSMDCGSANTAFQGDGRRDGGPGSLFAHGRGWGACFPASHHIAARRFRVFSGDSAFWGRIDEGGGGKLFVVWGVVKYFLARPWGFFYFVLDLIE